MYDWILTQWFLHDAGLLSQEKVEHLNAALPGWFEAYSIEENGGHPLVCENQDLHDAFEENWNAHRLSAIPLTFAEIQIKAKLEA
jgi:hypothetical protein